MRKKIEMKFEKGVDALVICAVSLCVGIFLGALFSEAYVNKEVIKYNPFKITNQTCDFVGITKYDDGTRCMECVQITEVKQHENSQLYKNTIANNNTYFDKLVDVSKCQ